MHIGANFGKGPIVVGTDFSAASRVVVEYAAELARIESKPLYLAHVMPVVPEDPAPLLDMQEEELRLRVEKAAQTLSGSGITVKGLFSVGSVAHNLVHIVDKLDAACIVVGTEGLRGFDRLLLGSVAETVIRKSNRPVIVVGPQAVQGTAKTLPWKHLMLACNTAHGVTEAAHLAGNIALSHHARLTVFNVKESGLRNLSEDEFAAMEQMMSPEAWRTVKPQCLIRAGDPAREIVRMVEDSRADLLVMSVQDGGEMLTHFRRGILAKVLRMSGCPVMILRDPPTAHNSANRQMAGRHMTVA